MTNRQTDGVAVRHCLVVIPPSILKGIEMNQDRYTLGGRSNRESYLSREMGKLA